MMGSNERSCIQLPSCFYIRDYLRIYVYYKWNHQVYFFIKIVGAGIVVTYLVYCGQYSYIMVGYIVAPQIGKCWFSTSFTILPGGGGYKTGEGACEFGWGGGGGQKQFTPW